MIVENHTPYPDAEVTRLVSNAVDAQRGPRPARIRILYRTLPNDTRLGFTPYDHRRPMDIWLEPKNRYPQPGARNWRDELVTTTLHEMRHFRSKCKGPQCEKDAEDYAQKWRKKLRR